MLLEALQDIPSSVSAIMKGQTFREPDPARAQDYLVSGMARVPVPKSNGSDFLSWPGAAVAILASGPSLSVEQCDAVKAWRDADPTRKVVAINTTFRRAPWADVLYACDEAWWKIYADEVAITFAGQKWTQDAGAAKAYGLKLMRSMRGTGLSKVEGVIHQGESSGYQAIGLLWQGKVAKVYLLGYDNHGNHWHGNHPSPLNKNNPYARWATNLGQLAKDCDEAGMDIVNCTPKSALKAFPAAPWQDVFAC